MVGWGWSTNPLNDLYNTKLILVVGANPAETHPVAMRYILQAKANGAKLIVCDPRRTQTAAHADIHLPLRPGTDVALAWGLLKRVYDRNRQDKEFIRQRVWGLDYVRKEVGRWTQRETERVTGVPKAQIRKAAQLLADLRPGTLICATGITHHTSGADNAAAWSAVQFALGNVGKSGGGMNILAGHDNAMGATNMGLSCHSLPAYYGLRKGAWQHWCRVWNTDYDYFTRRFGSEETLQTKGVPVSRLADAVLLSLTDTQLKTKVRGVILWGPFGRSPDASWAHAGSTRSARSPRHCRPVCTVLVGCRRAQEQRLSSPCSNAI